MQAIRQRTAGLVPQMLPSATPSMSAMPKRTMATEEQMKRRLSTVKVVEKLTRAMKMVAVVRMQRYERAFNTAKVFSDYTENFYSEEEEAAAGDDLLVVSMMTDRGLCGSVNSQTVRAIKIRTEEAKAAKINTRHFICGTKNRANITGDKSKIEAYVSGIMGQTYAFETVLQLSHRIAQLDFTHLNIIGNQFRSLFNLNPETISTRGWKKAEETQYEDFERFLGQQKLRGFEDVVQNFHEFRLACIMFTQLKNSDLCEQASRMMAMDTASTNAEDMRKALTLAINRRRQAKVTTDLLEIIAGVVGVEQILKEDAAREALANKKK
jgi:F-type H+-transporting ATPase subunit gamma